MHISCTQDGSVWQAACEGRMDTVGSRELEAALKPGLAADMQYLVLDLAALSYISSAGLRVLLATHKQLAARGGEFMLAAVPEYASQVLDVTGFTDFFKRFATAAEARQHCRKAVAEQAVAASWAQLETHEISAGRLRVIERQAATPIVKVMGDIKDVLHARVTPRQVESKKFFETEYSIGFGGLGDQLKDYFQIMGEMITVGGTMVWLPTDGQDTPDFLIPKVDKGDVMIRTGYNVSIAGDFNECVLFESRTPEGCPVGALYTGLFEYAKKRAAGYHGMLGLAMVADMATIMGSGIRKSAVVDFTPANGKMITHESNITEWMECDKEPRQRDVTALVVGVGACLADDLSDFNEEQLNKVFYLHPANVGVRTQMLHNHAVMFKPLPFPPQPVDLTAEIQRVVQEGEFLDMRHLLDNSCVRRALIGLAYIQEVAADERALPGHTHDEMLSASTRRNLGYYQS